MKKALKFGCLGFIGLIVIIVIIAMVSGGDEEKISTGTNSSKQTETTNSEEKNTDSKKINASSQTIDAIGLKVGLGEVKVTKNKIQVGINAENTSSQAIMFYPDQGSAIVGNMQLDANMFLTDGDIGGEIQPGVKQEAVLEFLTPEGKEIDVENVNQIKFVLGDATTADFMNSKPVEFVVPIK